MESGRFKKLGETLERCDIDSSLKREILHTLEDLRNKKRYGLVWNREKVEEKVVSDCRKRMPILESVKEKRIVKDGNSGNNIFIEGDNYHALHILQHTHCGKIDVIYIDPPYNTGDGDLVFNDTYVDSEDDYRHSKWLSFMEKRLELAKKLLSETGVIFISIDDNEQANLKLLCDEMFGEDNFVQNFMWLHGKWKKDRWSRTLQQYILCYAYKKEMVSPWKLSNGAGYNFQIPNNIIEGVGSARDARNELDEMLGEKVFEYPKPTGLIKYILKFSSGKNSTVLDFFAGSGTTGQAVLELNKEDGGNRQFILCTNNENNNGNGHIAEKVCYPRIKKAIEGYRKNGEAVAGLGGGLEYFKTDFVNVDVFGPTDQDRLVASRKIGCILGMRHNCFEEVVSESHYQIFANKEQKVFIYFEEGLGKFREFQGIHAGGNRYYVLIRRRVEKSQYGMRGGGFSGHRSTERIPQHRFFSVYMNRIS